jgi:hypothetical protein
VAALKEWWKAARVDMALRRPGRAEPAAAREHAPAAAAPNPPAPEPPSAGLPSTDAVLTTMPAEADVASAIRQAGDALPAAVEIDGLIASESTAESTEGAEFRPSSAKTVLPARRRVGRTSQDKAPEAAERRTRL